MGGGRGGGDICFTSLPQTDLYVIFLLLLLLCFYIGFGSKPPDSNITEDLIFILNIQRRRLRQGAALSNVPQGALLGVSQIWLSSPSPAPRVRVGFRIKFCPIMNLFDQITFIFHPVPE